MTSIKLRDMNLYVPASVSGFFVCVALDPLSVRGEQVPN